MERAEQVLRDVQRAAEHGTATEEEVGEAERNLAEKEASLNRTKVEALAANSNLSAAEIESMRASGMGWGRIAKEAGVHPSVLGTGSGKSKGKAKGKGKSKGKDWDMDEDADDADDEGGKGNGNKNKGKGKGKGKK